MNTVTRKTKGAKNAPKTKKQKVEATDAATVEIKIETPQAEGEQAAAPVTVEIETTPAPKAKASGKSKKAAAKSAKDDRETSEKAADETAVSMPAPLAVDSEVLRLKIQQMQAKLEKAKLQATKNAQHVAFGYFVCKTTHGNVLTLQYHPEVKGKLKWSIRDTSGEPQTSELFDSLWRAHETAVRTF
jgi:NADH dehydrogenase/NADH:ubiquinone oxidoreductase subunit G